MGNNVRELDFDELSLESCATDTNTVSSVRRQLSLEERLNILQQDHKEREKNKSNSVAGSKNLKKNESDENNGKIFNNSVEEKEMIEALANEKESAIPGVVKGEEGKYVVEETVGKEIEIEEKEKEAQEMGLKEEEEDVKEKGLEGEEDDVKKPMDNSSRFASIDRSIMETSGDEEVEKIISQDCSIVDEQGKEQYMPDSQNKTLPMPSTIKSNMVNNNLPISQPESQESISAANKNKVAIEVPAKEEEVSVPPVREITKMNTETPAASTIPPVETREIVTNAEEEIETTDDRDEKKKSSRVFTTAAAGVAGGVASFAVPAVATGVVVGIGSALIANKIGKKIQKKQRKNEGQSFRSASIHDKASVAGNEILGKMKTFAGTIY